MNMAEQEKMAPLLRIEDLHVQFGRGPKAAQAVAGVNLTLERGRVLGLVGESGSGKSVSCLSVLDLLPSTAQRTAGRILFEGEDLCQASTKRMRQLRGSAISLVSQDPQRSLIPWQRVGAQVGQALRLHRGLSKVEARKEALRLFEQVGLTDPQLRLDQYPHELSGGMCQRVVIAMAIACQPHLLLADEPTTALDVTVQAQILGLFRQLVEETGAGLLLVSHDLGVVAGLADDVAVMYAGRVVEYGPVAQIFAAPAHPYTAALMAASPQLDGPRGPLHAIPGLPPRAQARPPGCAFHPRCAFATARCHTEQPQLEQHGARAFACHEPRWRPAAADAEGEAPA